MDEAPGSVSFHLGKLAEHGFIVEAPELARDGRERWWRAAHESTRWEPGELLNDPERRTASSALRQQIRRLYLERLETWLAEEPSWDREWVSAAASGDQTLHLSATELASQVLLVDAATFAVSAALLSMVVPRAVRAADEPAPGRYLTSCAKASRSSAMTR